MLKELFKSNKSQSKFIKELQKLKETSLKLKESYIQECESYSKIQNRNENEIKYLKEIIEQN